ncbi:MAG TPA: hypothetical protein VFI73_11270 [Candidatus Nitrosopolaris sp.]|nr:hypothetical protein [Candidatus Nitrosopolaris sp.]
MRNTVSEFLNTRMIYYNIVMKKLTIIKTTTAIAMSVVVATMLVAGALVFPYNHVMASGKNKNHDASHSNTAISIVHSHAKSGNANGGSGGTSINGGSANGGNGGTSGSASSNVIASIAINENGVR